MSEERKLILNLLAEGKVTAEEADELLEALEQDAFTKQEEQEQKAQAEAASSDTYKGAAEAGAKEEKPKPRLKSKLEIGNGLEDRLSDMAVELEELVGDIPEKVQKALDSVTITKDGKKSTLTEMLKSWGISDIGGISATPSFKMGTAEVIDRLPISVTLTNGTARFFPNEEGTDIKVSSKIYVKNAPREEVQKIASKHIEVFFDPKNGLRVRSLDSRDVNVMSVEVMLPKHLNFDIAAQSVNGSVKLEGISAKSATLKTVNGGVSTLECTIDRLDSQTVNGAVRLAGTFKDANASTVNGGIRASLVLAGGNVHLNSNNGTVKAVIDHLKSVPMQLKASSRNGSLRMGIEGLETVQETSIHSMHKSGTWRSIGYAEAKVRADVELETRNGSTVVTSEE